MSLSPKDRRKLVASIYTDAGAGKAWRMAQGTTGVSKRKLRRLRKRAAALSQHRRT